jgi:hypothetical protein
MQARRQLSSSAAAADATASDAAAAAAAAGEPQQPHGAGGPDCAEARVGPHSLVWECGRLARLAHGACLARYGGTAVLSTVVLDPTPLPDADGPQLQARARLRARA